MSAPIYLHLRPGDTPPSLGERSPFKTVVVIESEVTPEWRAQVSDWLVENGCLYMMAWGQDCSKWDDSVDWAVLEKFDYGDIPDEAFVMTTWHDGVPLDEVFWFCQHCAFNEAVEFDRTYILHIADEPREAEMLSRFQAASNMLAE
ncbi:MAG: hypothetical protein U1E67_12425 [Hyphomicrobiales bacterium]